MEGDHRGETLRPLLHREREERSAIAGRALVLLGNASLERKT
jgi:hypothetical protein